MRKHFLLLFLMALLPMVGWGHNATWNSSANDGNFVWNGTTPSFNNYLSVTTSTNQTCSYTGTSSTQFPQTSAWQPRRYTYSIHATQTAAENAGATTTITAPGTYYLRVSIAVRNGNPSTEAHVLPFNILNGVTVTLKDFSQNWSDNPAFVLPTAATLPTDAYTFTSTFTSSYDAVKTYLTWSSDAIAKAGEYDYTLTVDDAAAKAAYLNITIAGGPKKYTINKIAASAGTVKFTPKAGLTYNGETQALVTVENATTVVGGTLVYSVTGENGEYDAENYKQVNAGEYELWYKVEGDDNHNDTKPASIGTIAIAKEAIGYVLGNAEEIYDGHAWTPLELAIYSKISGTFYNGDNLATLGISFQFPEGKEPKNAGEYTFSKLNVVYANESTPKNYNFIFTFTSTVNILKKDFAGVKITGTETATWDGKAQDPKWTVTDGDPSIITDADYAVVIKDEDGNVVDPKDVIEVGEYTYTFTPTENGNYEGAAIEKTFTIEGIVLVEDMLTSPDPWIAEVVYDGENHAPESYTLKAGNAVLTSGVDYDVVITNTVDDPDTGEKTVVTKAINADTYTFTFTGIKHYAGSFTKTLKIAQKTITADDIVMSETSVYNAAPQYPEITSQLTEDDVEVSVNTGDLDDVVNAGNYTYTFKGIGNYTGSITKPFEVTPATIQISIKQDLHKDYDGTTNLGSTLAPVFEYSGLQGDDKATDITYSTSSWNPAWSVEGLTKNVKEDGYALTINPNRFWYKRNTAEANNYDFAVNEEITRYLFIDPIELTISFIDHDDDGNYLITKNYGQADNFNTTAWKNAHLKLVGNVASEANSIRESVVISRTNADVEAVGKYNGVLELAEMLGASVFDNYDVKEFVAGDFEILPSGDVLNVTLKNDRTKEYNGQAFTLTITKDDLAVSGYKNGDTFETTFTQLPDVTFEGNVTDAGEYAIVLSGDYAPNYTINYTNARLFITPKPITGTVATQTVHVNTPEELDQSGYTLNGVEDRDKDKMGAKLSFNPATVIEAAGEFEEGIKLTITNGNYELPATYGKLIVVATSNVVLSKTNDNTDVIKAVVESSTEGKNATVTFDNFDMKANQWYAICLPFDVNPATLSKAFGYAVTDVIDETNADDMKVRFNLNMGTIKAHTPFIIKLYEAINMNKVTFEKVDITEPEGDMIVKDAANNQFIGTYTGVQFNEETNKNVYILSLSDGDFHPASATAKVRPLGAYVQGTKDWSAAGGRLVIEIEEPDGTTSINTINAEGKLVSAEGWYTVSGVKLQGAPTQKGVYIKDGKKVIIK